MLKQTLIGAAAIAMLMASSAQAAPNLISNGDFEAGLGDTITDWTQIETEANSLLIATGQAYQMNAGGSGSAAALANQFLSFGAGDSSNAANIAQTFSATQSGLHRLTFDFGAFGSTQSLLISVLDLLSSPTPTIILSQQVTKPGTTNLDTLFSSYSYDLNLAAGGSYGLQFSNALSPTHSADALLDNVSVAAVPEPTTWMMAIAGLALTGFSMRRRTARTNRQFA